MAGSKLKKVTGFLEKHGHEGGLFVLRVALGGMMAVGHGWPKLLKAFSPPPHVFPDPYGIGAELSLFLAILGEVVAALGLMAGILPRLSAAALAFVMGTAVFVVHAADPVFGKGGPSSEMAALYGIGFLALAMTGPGSWTLPNLMERMRK